MSASPAGPGPTGQKPTPPAGAPPLRKPPRSSSNPLVARKKPIKRQPMPAGTVSNPKRAINLPGVAPRPGQAPKPQSSQSAQQAPPDYEALRKQNEGWSFPKPAGANDFPLVITKKALKEGLRFHVMKLAPPQQRLKPGDPGIDPSNQNEFTRPVTLHRRDPRQPPPGREVKEEPPAEDIDPAKAEEAEKLAQQKAEREAQRALDNAQKAPVMKDQNAKKQPKEKKNEKKPATQVNFQARTEQQKRESEIRYEEALPWHLEDADGKNVWVGQYEAPLSMQKVALQIDGAGFRMIPLEKWYKFSSKRGAIQTMTVEEAEKSMAKKAPIGRWAARDAQREKNEKLMAESRQIMYGRTAVKQESASFRQASSREKMDHDDLDVSGDEFQDDDETAGYEPDKDEDVKDAKERVRREQLGANLFGDADEKEVEKAEAAKRREEEKIKLLGKDLKKALKKRDKQFQYESDDSSNRDPFASSSSESDSDSDNEENDEEKKAEKNEKEKAASGSSSKGTNTPQGKKSAAEANKKSKSLKRPGSPVMSDSSGTESTRAKKKTKIGPTTSVQGSRGGTPLPGNQRGRTGAGSGSDGEATAGEMSDGAGGKKKQRPHLGTGPKGSPAGSRAGSPAPQGGKPGSKVPRAASPMAGSERWRNPPTEKEIFDALPPPPQGMLIKDLLAKFQDRVEVEGCMPRQQWLSVVRRVADWNKTDKLLRRKA